MFEVPETVEEQLQGALDLANGAKLRELVQSAVARGRVMVFVTIDTEDLPSLNEWLEKDSSTDADLYRPIHERLAAVEAIEDLLGE